jgi:hypothetical protein
MAAAPDCLRVAAALPAMLTDGEFRVAFMDAARANGALEKHGPQWAVTTIRNALKTAQNDQLPPLARQFRTGAAT